VPDRIRLVFMGTPDLARTVLGRIADHPRFDVLAAVAQPDRPVGRHLQLTPPPVKVEALLRGIPVLQPDRARDPDFLDSLRALAPDVIVVAAYGQILSPTLLDIPGHGCLNVHTSLLPRWRGAAPIQWAIASGDSETGVCLMRMEAGLDTGPVIATLRTPIHDTDDARILHDRLAQLGGDLVVDHLPAWIAGELPAIPQPVEGVTYARKITRDDGRIDWSQPALHLWRRLRAFTPWPGAFCSVFIGGTSRLLKIHAATPLSDPPAEGVPGEVVGTDADGFVVVCGQGALRITEVQPEGGRRQSAVAFLAGHPVTRLG